MRIQSLDISNCRIIEHIQVQLDNGINLVFGCNGAGKTSLIESIYLLARAKTFRHSDAGPMLRDGSGRVIVTAELVSSQMVHHRLGISRGNRAFEARLDGNAVNRISELFEALPLLLIAPQVGQLVESAEFRRKFLNYGLFHVEPSIIGSWNQYSRSLKQRNSALRLGDIRTARSFNQLLVTAGTVITEHQRVFTRNLQDKIQKWYGQSERDCSPKIEHYPGWSTKLDIDSAYIESEARDLALGYTTCGSHKADLRFRIDGVDLGKRLSRGQLRQFIFRLNFAVIEQIKEAGLETPILLVDDISAEFDQEKLSQVLKEIASLGVQTVMTAVERTELLDLFSAKTICIKKGQLC